MTDEVNNIEWARELHAAGMFHNNSDAIAALLAERDALCARLEVTPQGPDGIDARDETIRVLEGERDKLRADAEAMRLPSSYGGSTFDAWGDQKAGCTIRVHFTDATQAEAWFNRLTDKWDAARGMGEAQR